MEPSQLLQLTLIPIAATAVLLALARWTLPARVSRPAFAILIPLLIAGAAVFGYAVLDARPQLWPASAVARFPAVALVAAAAGLLTAARPVRRRLWLSAPILAAAGAFIAWAFLGALHESLITEPARWAWIAAIALLAPAQAFAAETAVRRLGRTSGPLLLWLLAGLVTLGATAGFANALFVGFPIASVCFAAAALARPARRRLLRPGAATSVSLILLALVTCSNWFGDHERWLMLALLAAASLAPALLALPPIRRRGRIAKLAVAILPVLLLAGAQAVRAVPPLIQAQTSTGYDYTP